MQSWPGCVVPATKSSNRLMSFMDSDRVRVRPESVLGMVGAVRSIHAVASVQTGAGQPRARTSAPRAMSKVAAAPPRSTAASAFRADTVRSATSVAARARYGGGGRALLRSVASQPRATRGCRVCVVTVVAANQVPSRVAMALRPKMHEPPRSSSLRTYLYRSYPPPGLAHDDGMCIGGWRRHLAAGYDVGVGPGAWYMQNV